MNPGFRCILTIVNTATVAISNLVFSLSHNSHISFIFKAYQLTTAEDYSL